MKLEHKLVPLRSSLKYESRTISRCSSQFVIGNIIWIVKEWLTTNVHLLSNDFGKVQIQLNL